MHLKNVTGFNDKFLYNKKRFIKFLSNCLHFFTSCNTVDFFPSLALHYSHAKHLMTGPSGNSEFKIYLFANFQLGCALRF